jgi:integrase
MLVCNTVAQSVVESVRGKHGEFVFPYRGGRIETMNNTAWQRARREAGISDLHIHDLRHTVGMRLREAEVREETIADILWHTRPGMTAHYSVAQVAELVEALNRITDERSRTNRSLAMIAREAKGEKIPHKLPMQMKNG